MDSNATKILNPAGIGPGDIVAIHPIEDTAQGITILWSVGKRCNYACSYCWKDLHDRISPHRSFEEMVKAWLRLKMVVKSSGRPARIIFTGGEPTLNPDFARLVEFLDQTQRRWIKQMGVTTNGSETTDYYAALIKNLDFLTFSTHFEWWDEKAFMTTLLDIWRSSGRNQTGKWLSVNLMYESWAAPGVQRIRNILIQENIQWRSMKVINFYGSKGIANKDGKSFDYADYLRSRGEASQSEATPEGSTDNLTDVLLEDAEIGHCLDVEVTLKDGSVWKADTTMMMGFGLTNFPGWTCHINKSLYIHTDGDLWAGNCRFQKLGNVFEAFTPLPGPVTCDGRFCMCPLDIQIEKHNPSPGQETDVPLHFRPEWIDRSPKNQQRTTG